jgi:hypothetical protein
MINYTTLKTELTTDPKRLGYATRLANGDDAGVADVMNNRTLPSGAAPVWRNDVRVGEIVNNIQSADFSALNQLQCTKLQLLFSGQNFLDTSLPNLRSNFSSIFSGMTTTLNALTAMAQPSGSRGEVIFGWGTVITANDVATAIGS